MKELIVCLQSNILDYNGVESSVESAKFLKLKYKAPKLFLKNYFYFKNKFI